MDTPYHPGEIALQERAGVRERAERGGQRMIRDFMPDQHRDFFTKLPFLLVGSLDDQGQPWASMLVGEAGFVASPDPQHLRIAPLALPSNPALAVGTSLGLLGIQPETRRRNRMNGRIVAQDATGFTVRVEQSFGNCPQYITPRRAELLLRQPQAARAESAVLSAEAAALIAHADTFFIASAAPGAGGDDTRRGVDVSHRGGPPGFVRYEAGHLLVPDYPGNNMFNTLGNLLLEPRAGLLFFDPASGDLLQLIGRAEIVWLTETTRELRFAIQAGLWRPGAIPLQFIPPQP
jgi:predicted pyridoxine 5'-phosphate oxidase superfamily flavin-nucleotide-binding protein